MQEFSGRFVQLDTFNKGHTFQRFDTNCNEMPAKSCMQPSGCEKTSDFWKLLKKMSNWMGVK
jgi:hypothetical protein